MFVFREKTGQMVPVKHFSWNKVCRAELIMSISIRLDEKILKISNCKLEAETGMRVNTVILDCEGCWVDLVSTYRDKFRHNVDKIILGR